MRSQIARRYGFYALAAGLLVASASFVSMGVLTAIEHLHTMDGLQQAASNLIRAIDLDTRNVLKRLNRNHPPVCTEESLRSLRQEKVISAYQVDIGVLDEQLRLLCSTVRGRLPAPEVLPEADVRFETDLGEVYSVNYQLPLVIWGTRYGVTVTRSGRFYTMVSPHHFEALFAKDDGTLRIVLPGGRSDVVHADAALPNSMQRRLADEELIAGPVHRFSWSDRAFISSRMVSGTRYLSQYVTPLREFLGDYRSRLSLSFLLALLSGVLTYAAVLPVFRRWGGLEYRIAGLLVERNILCMYQPIIDLRKGTVAGCEVLMRLRDGDAVIYPDQVIPALERGDLYWALDRAVVSRALSELCSRLPNRHDLEISLNFFPKSIDARRLEELISGTLKRIGHGGFRFTIEVIERHYRRAVLVELDALKKSGFQVSVDDFGTGYSNLGSIKAMAPDYLKIDKSFVLEMEDASVRSSLIPEIVGIARAVGASVIAEGIENEAQRARLTAFGVDYGQGYWFARPMVIDDFVRYLSESEHRAAADTAPPS